ncbi:MAG: hypothetical protein AB7D05_07615, partial [Mangrovibacterium sp.]
RTQIEHMVTILEQYLKGSASLSPNSTGNRGGRGNMPVSGKSLTELSLKCLSLLAACLPEQLRWECEEQSASFNPA